MGCPVDRGIGSSDGLSGVWAFQNIHWVDWMRFWCLDAIAIVCIQAWMKKKQSKEEETMIRHVQIQACSDEIHWAISWPEFK